MPAQNATQRDFLFISFAQPESLYCDEHVYIYIHISDSVEIAFEIPLLPNNTTSETFLHKLGAVQCIDWIYHQGTGLAVTGQIRDFGQNVSQSSFQTGSSSNPVTSIFSSLLHSSRRCVLDNNYSMN